MNPLQAAPASDKHQDNQMGETGAANNQCHLVIIETITFTCIIKLYMCKQMQQPSNIDASMLVVLSNNVGTCSVSWERYFNPYKTLKTIGNAHVWLTQC